MHPREECKDKMLNKEKALSLLQLLDERYPEAGCALNYDGDKFRLLIAVVLSAQTTDKAVNLATPALFERWPDAEALSLADPSEVSEYIHSIGMYKTKSNNIVALSKMLTEEYGGKVPDSEEELIRLPGVGRKTANVVRSEGFGQPAIAVDTHVFRVSNRTGLAKGKTPDEVEKALKKKLPKELWSHAHHLLIFHGRYTCHARRPECESCVLASLCERHGV